MIYPVVFPSWVKWLYPDCMWSVAHPENRIFLTFDDGPIPGPTEIVLNLLKQYEAKGNFFCIGDNVGKYPSLFQRILNEGHLVGNHTYHHLNAWKVGTKMFLKDIEDADALIDSKYFRPPYGKWWPWQASQVKEAGKIPVMWSILSGDFDKNISKERCAENVLSHMQPGSIIVFHDSIKSEEKMNYALHQVLKKIQEKGWIAERLDFK